MTASPPLLPRDERAWEKAIIERAQGGDAEAYDALVSKYLGRVLSIAWGIVRSAHDAEDLAQDAFVKAYEHLGRFRSDEPFGPWIDRIVTNLSLDVLKHRRKFRSEELVDTEQASRRDTADLAAQSNEIAGRIDAAIETLPAMQRVVARLHLVEELEHPEIAAMTGLSEGTVRSHLSLARKKLRQQLADLRGDGDE
jgi:RNA polymerase sigma-70 factor (ECF subfamily)